MTDRACESCKKPIPRNAPGGLCPLCLLREGLREAATSSGQPGSQVDDSDLSETTLTPELAGRYTTLEGSGQGGMGKVYLVRDAQLGREIALKELIPRAAEGSPEAKQEERVALARFTREARVTAQLQHPAITPVYELGRRTDGSYYYTMKYVRGRTLAAALRETKSLEERLKLLPHFVALCHAIAFAHSRGVIHRDIKPSNVMVGDFGETVVVDWGLAKIKGVVETPAAAVSPEAETIAQPRGGSQAEPLSGDGLQTMHGTALGTPAYMPPEQAQGLVGSLDQRSDIYSLGAVLYEILSGRRPFVGTTAREILTEVLTRPPLPLLKVDATIPKEYARICERAMSRDPGARPATASELAEQVQGVRLPRPKSRARRFLERAALFALFLVPMSVIALNRWTDAEVDRTLERLSAKGFDLRSGPLEYAPASRSTAVLPPGARHAAGTLYALSWEFPQLGDTNSELWKRTDALNVRQPSFPWAKGSEKEAQARALSAEVGPILAAVRSIASLPRGGGRAVVTRAMRHAQTPFAIEVPQMTTLTSAATLLAHSSYLAYVDGRVDPGIDATVAGLQFASHFEDLPFLLGALVRIVIVERTLAPLEHASLRDSSEASLASLDQALRESSIGPSITFATESELRGVLFAFHLIRAGRAPEVAVELGSDQHPVPPIFWAVYGRGPLRWWGNWDEILQINLMTDAFEATKRPPHEALAELGRIDREVERLNSRMHPMFVMFPSVKATVDRVAKADSALMRARLRVALERFRRKQGTWPASLQELVPAWLETTPVHVRSGAPFLYQRTATGYELKDPPFDAK